MEESDCSYVNQSMDQSKSRQFNQFNLQSSSVDNINEKDEEVKKGTSYLQGQGYFMIDEINQRIQSLSLNQSKKRDVVMANDNSLT